MIEYVAGFLFRNQGTQVALIEKQKPAWQAGKLNGIGGKIEPNESPEKAMIREFEEETGAHVVDWRLFCRLNGPDWTVHMYVSFDPVEIKSMEAEKVDWYYVEYIADHDTIPNLRWLIPLALDPDHVTATVKDNHE